MIIAMLQRMEKNLEEDRRQNRKVSTQLEKIISELFEIRKENTFLRKKTEVLEKTCNDLRDDVERLERQLSRETELRNTLEQYTRKDNIKIINFPNDSDTETADDTEKKVLDFMQNTPGLRNFTAHYVSVAHRVGKYRQKQNRPVIVRLTNRKVKTDIFKQRKKLREFR